MKLIILNSTIENDDWIVIIGLIAGILGIIDFFTNRWVLRVIKSIFGIILTIFSREYSNGIVPRKYLNVQKKLKGEVFAVELLTQKIIISKNERNDTIIEINRDSIKEAIISNKGKEFINDKYVQNNQDEIRKIENEVQEFLLKPYCNDNNKYIILLQNMPLRWSSGGVLSIVNYKDRKWIPMFYRDKAPFGWNIALGSTERSFKKGIPDFIRFENELKFPMNFIEREFLEETIVLTEAPHNNKKVYSAKFFKSLTNNLDDKTLLCIHNYNDHIKLREEYDGIVFKYDHDNYIPPKIIQSNMEVRVTKGNKTWPTRDIFICFNLLELGIEVVKVIEYNLNENDYLLDGEVLEKDGIKELVRMPFALLSMNYLKNNFKVDTKDSYTSGVDPSIDAPQLLTEQDIVLFDYDLIQRYKIIDGKKNGIGSELDRYKKWYQKDHDYFKNDNGNIIRTNLPKLFTPATVKIFKLYLNYCHDTNGKPISNMTN